MTDRHAGYIVTLEKNIREDDAETLRQSIAAFRSVRSVEPIVADHTLSIAEARVRGEMRDKFHSFLLTL